MFAVRILVWPWEDLPVAQSGSHRSRRKRNRSLALGKGLCIKPFHVGGILCILRSSLHQYSTSQTSTAQGKVIFRARAASRVYLWPWGCHTHPRITVFWGRKPQIWLLKYQAVLNTQKEGKRRPVCIDVFRLEDSGIVYIRYLRNLS